MKKYLLSISIFIFCFIFGQDRKGEFRLQKASNSHTLYVAFKDQKSFEKNVFKIVENKNSNFKNFIFQNQITFDGNLAISEDRKNDFYEKSKKNVGHDDSVRKLERIYKIKVFQQDNETLLKLAKEFETFDEVEYASLISNEPVKPPFIKRANLVETPSLESNQNYLFDNPGINVDYAWSIGINGKSIKVKDVEYGPNKAHESIKNINKVKIEPGFAPNSSLIYPQGEYYDWLDHGTAVASIMTSERGSSGLSGTAYNLDEFVSYLEWPTVGYSRTNAVRRAINASGNGDIIIYEMQTSGKDNQYVPAEFDNVIWDLTKAATDSGITIIAAAGNGAQNLDDPYYNAYNARGNSGAIIVGAGSSNTQHSTLYFSTYGSRVDIQGWGENVLAAGYGDYAKYDGDYNRFYTRFNGTSSATPIVASAFALVQAYYYAKTGLFLSTKNMLTLLLNTGIPQGGNLTKKIGPLPNVKAAIEKLKKELSVKDDQKPLSIKVFPNPAKDYINITTKEISEIEFEIYNSVGQLVLKSKTKSNGNYDISSLAKGYYMIKAYDGKRIALEKLIKE